MSRAADGAATKLPFGPYRGRAVDDVAVMDPPYLERLVREGVGSPRLRAEAARALARLGMPGPDDPSPDASPWRDGAAASAPIPSRPPSSVPQPRETRCRWLPPGSLLPAGAQLPAAIRRRWRAVLGVCALALLLVVAAADRLGGDGSRGAGSPASAGSDRGDIAASREPPSAPRMAVSDVDAGGAVGSLSPRSGVEQAELDGRSGNQRSAAASADGLGADAPCGERTEGAVSAEEATDLVDTFQPVEFRVARTKDTGRVTFLNSHDPYQGHFYVAVFPSDYDRYPEHPALYFRDRCIVVQGTIELYRGTPQIVLRGPDDVRIVGD